MQKREQTKKRNEVNKETDKQTNKIGRNRHETKQAHKKASRGNNKITQTKAVKCKKKNNNK